MLEWDTSVYKMILIESILKYCYRKATDLCMRFIYVNYASQVPVA